MTRGIFIFCVGLAAGNVPAPAPAIAPADSQSGPAPHEKKAAARRFVEDQAVNEKGGERMKEAFHRLYGEKIGKCGPIVDLDKSPNFRDMDSDGDGYITAHEAIAYGNKMCVPDEMTIQIFTAADVSPRDGKVTKAEFNASGEDTIVEKAIDKAADVPTEGDNEYAEVSLPDFETWDRNNDGFMTEGEAFNAFMWELRRRDVAHHSTVTSGSGVSAEADKIWEHIFEKLFPEMDVNGDHKISRKEYYGPAIGGDFGDELRESALADEDAPDPDSNDVTPPQPAALAPAPATPSAPAAPASMLRSAQRSVADAVHFSAERDRASLRQFNGAMRGLMRREDELAESKSVLAHMVDKAIRLRKDAAEHKHRNKFAHSKAI